MDDPAEAYAKRIDAVSTQRTRLHEGERQDDSWGGTTARRFRFDPHRQLGANIEAIASYIQPGDTVVDVGGGAGRVSLPLALRCQEAINIDPSPGMKAEFDGAASEAGITNARFIQSAWLEAVELSGDLVVTSNVSYFVRDIVTFVRKMDETAKRRVIMTVWSVPPPNQNAAIFQLVYGEEQEQAPGHKELLPVLWEMGILPDIRVLSASFLDGFPQTREVAMQEAIRGQWLGPNHQDLATTVIQSHFDVLYEKTAAGYRPLWRPDVRELLITWEPHTRKSDPNVSVEAEPKQS